MLSTPLPYIYLTVVDPYQFADFTKHMINFMKYDTLLQIKLPNTTQHSLNAKQSMLLP